MAGDRLVSMHFVNDIAVPAPQPQGFVYFVEAIGGNQIKIGWTDKHPAKRIAGLQTGSCLPLKGLGVLIGEFSLESEMHRKFQVLHSRGEWFHDHPRLRGFIEKEVLPWPTLSQKLIRPGQYEIGRNEANVRVASVPFGCDRCQSVIREGAQWFRGQAKNGDRARLCFGCCTWPERNAWRCSVAIKNLTYG